MVQMAFFLRFKRQLRRTRPELIPQLEELAIHAIKEAGGKIKGNRSLIQAQFDENSLGFWIDMLMLIETLTQTLEEAAGELYGYSIVMGVDLPDLNDSLCRRLAGGTAGGGVFLDQAATAALQPYVTVETGDWARKITYGTGAFSRLKEVKILVPRAKIGTLLWDSNIKSTNQGQQPTILVTNQSFEGKRDKLYLRVAGYANAGDDVDFPPLFIRFGYGGLNALTDCMRQIAGLRARWTDSEEITRDWEYLFRQRLNDTPSPFAIRTARRFFELLLTRYESLARSEGKTPVVIFENIHIAEHAAADIAIESLRGRKDFLLVGTCTGEIGSADIQGWELLFPQLVDTNIETLSRQSLPDFPPELWEVGYACLLLGQYFPPELLPQLFAEAGKSARMFSRAISLMYALGIIDTPLDPRPWHCDFRKQAEAALGERTERIRALVHSRLLAWVARKKIDPCLRLLEILKELNSSGDIQDSLLLRSIQHELICAHWTILKEAVDDGTIDKLAGPHRTPALRYIVETSLALHSGSANNIHDIFANPPPECPASPLLRAQALLNHALYHLGLRDSDSAVEAVKEAALLCQKIGAQAGACLAQAYRIFALASLIRRRIGETIDYIGFALENAAKFADAQDIGMAAYYAASVQLLYGNLSRSRVLAEKARRHFLRAGNPEWADRSRFLEGRLAFEIGSYQQAVDCFEDIRENPEGDNNREKIELLEAWAYRARVCCNSPRIPRPQGNGYDIRLFELEALCLAGDYSRVSELSGAPITENTGNTDPSAGEDFFCIERPDWRSGFAQCELLYFSWNDLRERMLCAYNSLAGGEEAMRSMQRILRSGQFPEIDPCDAFYHYAWYRVLKRSDANLVDISTAVSVAFKRLQGRAARIDDMEIRRRYLTQPYWNKALEKAARDFKLV